MIPQGLNAMIPQGLNLLTLVNYRYIILVSNCLVSAREVVIRVGSSAVW